MSARKTLSDAAVRAHLAIGITDSGKIKNALVALADQCQSVDLRNRVNKAAEHQDRVTEYMRLVRWGLLTEREEG